MRRTASVLLSLLALCPLAMGAGVPYFSDVRWHPGYGDPRQAVVYFTTTEAVDEPVTYATVGIATLTESCIDPTGTVVWTKTPPVLSAFNSLYRATYEPNTENSAMILGTRGPLRANFPVCFSPNTLRLDSVNWLAVTLYDLTEPGEPVQYPAVNDTPVMLLAPPEGGIDEPIPIKP